MLTERTSMIAGRYLLQQQVKRDGPAELYMALDRQLQRPVALEILSVEASRDEAFCESFRTHQKSASAIHHPHVLEIYDAGEWDGRPYLVMERTAGEPPLSGPLLSGNAIDLPGALRITRQAAEALAFCRQAGLPEWPFSYRTVRMGPSGEAQLALLDELLPYRSGGEIVARGDAEDPPALASLLALLLTGNSVAVQVASGSVVPVSVRDLLGRIGAGALNGLTGAGDVSEAIREVEAASNDFTQANVPAQSAVASVQDLQDLQRTTSISEAPTLAVSQPIIPYMAFAGNTGQGGMATLPPVPAESSGVAAYTPVGGYQPVVAKRKRRIVPFLLIPMLAILLLGAAVPTLLSNNSSATNPPAPASPSRTATSPTVAAAIMMPTLLGKTLDEARGAAEELGLSLIAVEPVYHGSIPPNRVVTQNPAPGADLKVGSQVEVALSLGPQPQQQKDQGRVGASPTPFSAQEPAASPSNKKQPPANQNKNEHQKDTDEDN